MARKKNPEVHVDINSHNFADNPRAVMDALGRLSQRPHKTKTGGETKKPSPRLKARRAKNTKKGYFPNPLQEKMSVSRKPANFPFVVQTQPTENWGTVAAFKNKEEAFISARAIAAKYPRLPVRVLHYTGGPM